MLPLQSKHRKPEARYHAVVYNNSSVYMVYSSSRDHSNQLTLSPSVKHAFSSFNNHKAMAKHCHIYSLYNVPALYTDKVHRSRNMRVTMSGHIIGSLSLVWEELGPATKLPYPNPVCSCSALKSLSETTSYILARVRICQQCSLLMRQHRCVSPTNSVLWQDGIMPDSQHFVFWMMAQEQTRVALSYNSLHILTSHAKSARKGLCLQSIVWFCKRKKTHLYRSSGDAGVMTAGSNNQITIRFLF